MRTYPRGSIIHSIPSFYPDRMQAGSATLANVALNTYAAVALFNNDPDAPTVVLWDVSVAATLHPGATPPSVVRLLLLSGTIGGGSNQTFPLYAGRAQTGVTVNFQNPFANPHGEITSWALTSGAYSWPHDWPICVLPPGWSAVIVSDFNQLDAFAVTFMFETVGKV